MAYLLWLTPPLGWPLGLHHLYLGRDAHATLHAATLGFYGLGWWRDLVVLPRYVAAANEEATHLAALKAEMSRTPTPTRGAQRTVAMLLVGMLFLSWACSCRRT